MNKKDFLVNPLKCIESFVTSIITLILAICMFIISRPISALIFIIITLVFLIMFIKYSAKISIQEDGVKRTILRRITHFYSWNEIVEIGVAGTKVFNKNNKKRTGTLYIYFNKQEMTEDERFAMMLNWPPKEKVYLQYTKERMGLIQKYWENKIQTWNIGNLTF